MQVTSTPYTSTAHFDSWLKSLSFWQLGSAMLTFELRAHDWHAFSILHWSPSLSWRY